MKKKYFLSAVIILLSTRAAFTQEISPYKWWNPAQSGFPVVQGQAWPKKVAQFYDRLPEEAKVEVNPSVWERSKGAAGLTICFYSNAPAIWVRYTVSHALSRPHIPTTGKSGLDLYAINRNGQWEWSPGRYDFGDTIDYRYSSLKHRFMQEYCLYLPYYNHVTWLEIGVPENATMKPVALSTDKPIVIYGTSITQGTAAPRPGLTWASSLGRRLHTPIVNLGFAGCGRLDTPVVKWMSKVNAKIYVLDCLPNLVGLTKVIKSRLVKAVDILQQKRPAVPILIVDDADAHVASLNTVQSARYKKVNEISHEAFDQLKASGIRNIYYLSADSIGLTKEDMAIDGVHPNAEGMEKYAKAYEKVIRSILHEPTGGYTTMQPCKQFRDRSYDWDSRHRNLLKADQENPPRIVLLGNSIVQHWGGILDKTIHRGEDSWDKYFTPLGVRNFGFGSDRIENLLWRVYHGELGGYSARQVVLMIGTNNLDVNSDQQIVAGIKFLIKAVMERQPSAKILMVGILPRQNQEQRVVSLDRQISRICREENIPYINPGKLLLDASGKKINKAFFIYGGLHPDAAGYEILAKAIAPYLVSATE